MNNDFCNALAGKIRGAVNACLDFCFFCIKAKERERNFLSEQTADGYWC